MDTSTSTTDCCGWDSHGKAEWGARMNIDEMQAGRETEARALHDLFYALDEVVKLANRIAYKKLIA